MSANPHSLIKFSAMAGNRAASCPGNFDRKRPSSLRLGVGEDSFRRREKENQNEQIEQEHQDKDCMFSGVAPRRPYY